MLFPEGHFRSHREFGADRGFLEFRADEDNAVRGNQYANKTLTSIKGLGEKIAHIAARGDDDRIKTAGRHRAA